MNRAGFKPATPSSNHEEDNVTFFITGCVISTTYMNMAVLTPCLERLYQLSYRFISQPEVSSLEYRLSRYPVGYYAHSVDSSAHGS